MPRKNTYPVNTERLTRVREAQAMTLEALSLESGVHAKTLRRIMRGERAQLQTIAAIAGVLGLKPDDLRADLDQGPGAATFRMNLTITGTTNDPAAIGYAVQITPQIVAIMKSMGLDVSGYESSMALTQVQGDSLRRTIVLLYGEKDNGGGPFWVFAAIKANMYKLFFAAHSRGEIDFEAFDQYGELIVSGDGTVPGDDMIELVAKMYTSDPEEFRRSVLEGPMSGQGDA